jgi:hypothetical protein
LYVRDVALALLHRGHQPLAYSPVLGEVADELRQATVPVLDDLAALSTAPDVIHGQHHLDAMTAMLRFPRVPAVFFCHGWSPWEEQPVVFPSIQRYIAVDDLCRERLLTTRGIPAEKVEVLYNFVDLSRFRVRGALPPRPASALVFSNSAAAGGFLEPIRAACLRFGIQQIDVAGIAAGTSIARPEQILERYDVVFAKARCALEAMAAGCAVIVADLAGLGGLVTSENVQHLRRLNFGLRTMQREPITEEAVFTELARYQPDDARRVTQWIRSVASRGAAIDRLLEIYAEAVSAARQTNSTDDRSANASLAAASDYLRCLALPLKTRQQAEARAQEASLSLRQAAAALDQTTTALRRAEERAEIAERKLAEIHRSRPPGTAGWYRRLLRPFAA